MVTPSPSQAGQAPCGELKEKSRGSISSMVKPETGQANLAEKISRSPESAFSAKARPSASSSAVSKESARRCSQAGPHDQAVDHHLDIVLALLVQCRRLGDLDHLAVDLDPLEAALLQVGQLLLELALAAARDRRQQVEPGALRQGQHAIHHLRDRLALDRQAGRGRVGYADSRPEQAHVVVDLGDRADGRARILRGRLLLDRDRRRQALDRVDVRLLHQLQELARVGGEQLDVAPLAFGVDRVEGKRGLAGAGKPGDDDQAVAGQVERDVLQIVLARAAYGDAAAHGLPDTCTSFPAPDRLRRNEVSSRFVPLCAWRYHAPRGAQNRGRRWLVQAAAQQGSGREIPWFCAARMLKVEASGSAARV